jgi:hypothetical protein
MEAPTKRVAQEPEHERLDSTMAEASDISGCGAATRRCNP